MANDIGNITASLKLESAAFIRELTRASQATAKSTSAMQRNMATLNKTFASVGASFKSVVGAFVSVAAVRSIGQLGIAAVKSADQIAASARKIGVSAEELQRWNAAAEQADVDVTELETAFKMFQRNLAQGKIQAEGRNMTEAFANFIQTVAEAPTQLEKTRLATEAAGRSASSILLLAASGAKVFSEELKNAFVVSNDLIAVGDRMDDEWARVMNAIAAGFQTGFLEQFKEGIGASSAELENFYKVARGLGSIVGTVVSWVGSMAGAFVNLRQTIFDAREEIRKAQAERAGVQFIPTIEGVSQANRPLPQFPAAGPAGLPDLGEGINKKKELAEANRAAAEAERDYNRAVAEGKGMVEATFSPLEQYADILKRLADLQKQNAISAADASRVQQRAALDLADSYIGAASQITGTLASAFQDNKAFAIANAVMNVAQGITQALTLPFPLNWAQVAAVTAAGVAQISQIKSARPNSSARPSASNGSGRQASAGGTVGPPTQDRAVFINLQGSGRYSRAEVEGLIQQLIEAQKDGAKLVLSQP